MRNITMSLTGNNEATLTTYILDGEHTRPAIVLFPGGGYARVSPREGEPVAAAFLKEGYHVFVVNYRVHPHGYPDTVLDGLKAVELIVEHHVEWRVDISKLVFCGFSAGGHLAALMALYHTKPDFLEGLPQPLIKPARLILGYPVITTGPYTHKTSFQNLLTNHPELREQMSLENQIHPDFPKTFVFHTVSDQSVPVENTLYLIQTLRNNNVGFEAHLFAEGPHGISLATEVTSVNPNQINPHVAKWFDLCIEWLNEIKE